MKGIRSLLNIAIFCALLSLIVTPSRVLGENLSGMSSLTPALLDISTDNVESGGYPVTFENGEDTALSIRASFMPFTQDRSADGHGTIRFMQGETSILRNFLTLSATEFVVQPRSKVTINIMPNSFSKIIKGDYYEALIFGTSPLSESVVTKKSDAPISSSLALLIFLRSDPTARPKYSLIREKLDLPNIMVRQPNEVSLVIENDGNTYGVPRGEVRIKSILGKNVARGTINEDSVRIIPGSSKKIDVKISTNTQYLPAFLGVFDIELRDYRQEQKSVIFSKRLFIIDPLFLMGLISGAVIFVFVILLLRVNYARRTKGWR